MNHTYRVTNLSSRLDAKLRHSYSYLYILFFPNSLSLFVLSNQTGKCTVVDILFQRKKVISNKQFRHRGHLEEKLLLVIEQDV